jgi:hypothetical protein
MTFCIVHFKFMFFLCFLKFIITIFCQNICHVCEKRCIYLANFYLFRFLRMDAVRNETPKPTYQQKLSKDSARHRNHSFINSSIYTKCNGQFVRVGSEIAKLRKLFTDGVEIWIQRCRRMRACLDITFIYIDYI